MLECGLRAVVLHNKEVVWNYYAEFTADCRRINTNTKNMQRSYLGTLGNVASGSVTLPGLSKYKWLIIVPYGGQPSAPAVVIGGGVRFLGVATDASTASIYEVGFWITGDTLTFSFNKSYSVPSGTESQMTFGDVYGIIE